MKVLTAGLTATNDSIRLVEENGNHSVQVWISEVTPVNTLVIDCHDYESASKLMNALMSKGIRRINVYP